MNIVVCVKHVPLVSAIRIEKRTGKLRAPPSIINPEDLHALEAALAFRDDGKVTALCMGTERAESMLRECLALGVDRAVLITDKKLENSDSLATSYVLASAIRKLSEQIPDLILCGASSIGGTGNVGPQLAELLGLPQITFARKLELKKDNKLIAEREIEHGYEVLETSLPAVVTVSKKLNKPRYPTIAKVRTACKQELIRWTADVLGLEQSKIGIEGSVTKLKQIVPLEPKGKCEIFNTGSLKGDVSALTQRLRRKLVLP